MSTNGKFFYGYDSSNIYLDNGASTLSLNCVKESGDEFLRHYGSVHRGAGYNSFISTRKYEDSRDYILNMIHGTEDDCLVFTANTTDAINKFALIYPFKEGDKVLVSDVEHTSNFLPWKKHAEVVTLKTRNFKVCPEDVEKALEDGEDVTVVAFAAASNITGYILDFKAIYEICKKHNVLFFLDCSQYAPHSLPDLRYCDMLAYCGHKMCAPFGCGILAGRRKYLNYEGESLTGGGNVLYVDENGIPIYKGLPWIHEAGTPNGIGAVTMARAHKFLFEEIGEEKLEEHTRKLLEAIKNVTPMLREAGYNVYFSEDDKMRTPILIVDNTKKSNKQTVEELNRPCGEYDKNVFVREGIFCAYRVMEILRPELKDAPKIINGKLNEGYSLIRLSAGFINDPEDIWYAARKLAKINQD